MENMKNIEVVKRLNESLEKLLCRYENCINNNDTKGGIESLRLVKDTMALIDNLDFQQMYGTYGIVMDDKEESVKRVISVWQQNSQGQIRDQRTWEVGKELDLNTLNPKQEKF